MRQAFYYYYFIINCSCSFRAISFEAGVLIILSNAVLVSEQFHLRQVFILFFNCSCSFKAISFEAGVLFFFINCSCSFRAISFEAGVLFFYIYQLQLLVVAMQLYFSLRTISFQAGVYFFINCSFSFRAISFGI